ncbi:MAG TPA: cytochrome C oxidase subunit IV family protein [Vicinamibacterales bacterium]|nr:cytochrome C oxidase subunit IV family protein [Vicinamibacterales bacterium]
MSGHAPITPVRTLVTIFITLLIFTGLTVLAATRDFGSLNTPVALLIAVTKATLVITFFMAVRYNTPLTKVVVISGFLWLFILFGLGLNDYLTRAWMGVPGR